MVQRICVLFVFCSLCFAHPGLAAQSPVPENVYQGELIRYPGPWAFKLPRAHIILVTDQELDDITDPDKPINMSLTFDHVEKSLRQICEEAKARGARTLIVAFDHFFAQYRPGQDKPRTLMPDMDAYIERIAKVSKFAETYGLGLELSLLSPLEIGPGYRAATGESGMWMHYRKGLRDPQTGMYSVELWQQTTWENNKGVFAVEDTGVRVFAFSEQPLHGTPYRAVAPESIVEITETAKVEPYDSLKTRVGRRIRVYGEGRPELGNLNRVLVVQQYRTPEMDYFSENTLPFLKGLIDKYAAAGVKLNGLYSDEMHIQQDWGYFGHHDHGEFALRYVSPALAKRFAEKYGEQYKDFAKYLVYFVHGQEDFASDLSAKEDIMHVFAGTPEATRQTALFRSRYYKLLQDGVVDLFAEAKRYAEEKMGHRLEARAHATWAESPTIDSWNVGADRLQRNQYEYTSNFVWSCTVHQAASACHDYFKWGDFLTGNGNDHAEGGWLDRNYFAIALACSTGILNEVPYSYAAHWGMPGPLSQRRMSVVNAYGAAGSPQFAVVEGAQHRDTDVLMLYPLDLVAADERFGSWMTQYGYANMITQAKLIERGKVDGGAIEVAGRRFTTLAAMFEPFPSKALLDLMRAFSDGGGRVVWSGPPPVLSAEGDNVHAAWQDLFGVDYAAGLDEGLKAPGKQVVFEGALANVAPQIILTDFIVDRIYPVTPREGTGVAARVKEHIVGTHRPAGTGTLTFLGYRPRDDQSKSLGYETRNWFEVFSALGAYPSTGAFAGCNDNTDYVSRTSPFVACRFPNGTVAIAPHFRDTEENWGGGFARKAEDDQKYLEQFPPPPDNLELSDFKVNGHTVTYSGRQAMAFRVDGQGNLIAFAGSDCTRVSVDGRETVFADQPFAHVIWAPVPEERRIEGGAVVQLFAHGAGTLRLPASTLPQNLTFIAEGPTPGSRGIALSATLENGAYVLSLTSEISGRWIYGVPM